MQLGFEPPSTGDGLVNIFASRTDGALIEVSTVTAGTQSGYQTADGTISVSSTADYLVFRDTIAVPMRFYSFDTAQVGGLVDRNQVVYGFNAGTGEVTVSQIDPLEGFVTLGTYGLSWETEDPGPALMLAAQQSPSMTLVDLPIDPESVAVAVIGAGGVLFLLAGGAIVAWRFVRRLFHRSLGSV